MTNRYSFKNVERYNEIMEENDYFIQYTNDELPDYVDSNYVLLNYSPTLPEFQLIEKLHIDFQQSVQQHHMKFCWPENTGMYMEILEYLNEQKYRIGKQELLVAEPGEIKMNDINRDIQIEIVSLETMEDFIELNHHEDLKTSQNHADAMKDVYAYQFSQPHVNFLLAFLKGNPVGSMTVIESDDFFEIDNVLTSSQYRKQGIASTLIHHVANKSKLKNKSVILIADAEDTPQAMYKKMGFHEVSSQICAEKTNL